MSDLITRNQVSVRVFKLIINHFYNARKRSNIAFVGNVLLAISPTREGKNNGNRSGNITEEIVVKTSIGNVFADFGLVNPDELLVKAEITRRINQISQQKNISNEQLSVILNIDKSQISDLIKGKISEFPQYFRL